MPMNFDGEECVEHSMGLSVNKTALLGYPRWLVKIETLFDPQLGSLLEHQHFRRSLVELGLV